MPLEIGRDLGWTLIHFLWQGLLLAALLHTILPAVPQRDCPAQLRPGHTGPDGAGAHRDVPVLHDFGKSGGLGFYRRRRSACIDRSLRPGWTGW